MTMLKLCSQSSANTKRCPLYLRRHSRVLAVRIVMKHFPFKVAVFHSFHIGVPTRSLEGLVG